VKAGIGLQGEMRAIEEVGIGLVRGTIDREKETDQESVREIREESSDRKETGEEVQDHRIDSKNVMRS
jgi:hypothetical protein